MWLPKNYCLLLVSLLVMGMVLCVIAQEEKKEKIASSEPSAASTANPKNPGNKENPKDTENSNPEKPEEKKEDPETPADQPPRDESQPKEPKEDAPQHGVVQVPTTTENPSELTIKSVINKLINADKADLKFCKFHLANYEIKNDNKSDNVKSASITQEMVDERLKDMVEKHQASEQAVNDAASVGIKNEGFFNEFDIKDAVPPEAKGFEANMDLLNGGAAEMVKIFTRWAEQGPELLKLIHLDDSSAKFTVDAGLTNSQVRLARNIYCVKKLALNVKNAFKHAEKPKPMRRTQNAEAAKGLTKTISYAITTVWIGHESVKQMKQIVKVSKELETLVHSAQNGMVKRGELAKQRGEMAKAIEDLANAEDQMMPSKSFEGASKRGSSMALMGVIFEKSCKTNLNVGCIQFFHVHSDDEYSP